MSANYSPSWSEGVIRWIYSTLIVIIMPLSFINLLVRLLTGKPGYDKRRFQRYGILPAPAKTGGILIHCVSVGEVVAASKLINKLIAQEPDIAITITTTTPTGSERVRQIFGDRVHHFYLPYDLLFTMRGMLNKVKPGKVLVTEVELWPNMIHASWSLNIPVFIINARMTDKSARNYARISALFTPMLSKITRVCAQGNRDADNYLKLGLSEEKLTLTRNIKFDIEPAVDEAKKAELRERFNPSGHPLIVAGSTHAPEENIMLDAMANVLDAHPEMIMLMVPRHPQRFDKVWQLIEKSGLPSCRSSQGISKDANIVMVDEMGVLASLYAISDQAFVGGSIAERGGHNALEASLYGVPVMMGPSTFNNPEICNVLEQAGAMVIVESAEDIARQIEIWLQLPEEKSNAGDAGKHVLESNRGAIDATLAELNKRH